MPTPQPEPEAGEGVELPVEELLRRGRPHPPFGDQVIEGLSPEEGSLPRRRTELTGSRPGARTRSATEVARLMRAADGEGAQPAGLRKRAVQLVVTVRQIDGSDGPGPAVMLHEGADERKWVLSVTPAA